KNRAAADVNTAAFICKQKPRRLTRRGASGEPIARRGVQRLGKVDFLTPTGGGVMKRRSTFLLATAVAAGISAGSLLYAHNPSRRTEQAPGGAPQTQRAQADVPVKVVVLFSSGVGYFEHFGTVKGEGTTELRFKTQQINDILKSLVLQDLDGGKVAAVTYPSQDPVAKTLKSFQVDITNNPSLAELLNQLRGAKVTISAGAENLEGTVLGVEKKQRPAGDAKDAKPIEVSVMNLVTASGIRSVQLDEV